MWDLADSRIMGTSIGTIPNWCAHFFVWYVSSGSRTVDKQVLQPECHVWNFLQQSQIHQANQLLYFCHRSSRATHSITLQVYSAGGRPLPGAKIDELIITVILILLGGGIPLFGELPERMEFDYVKTEIFLNAMVQNYYRRKKYP